MTTPFLNAPVGPLCQKPIDDMTMRLKGDTAQLNPRCGAFCQFSAATPPDIVTTEDVRQFQRAQSEAGVPVPTMKSVVAAPRIFFTNTDLACKLVQASRPVCIPPDSPHFLGF